MDCTLTRANSAVNSLDSKFPTFAKKKSNIIFGYEEITEPSNHKSSQRDFYHLKNSKMYLQTTNPDSLQRSLKITVVSDRDDRADIQDFRESKESFYPTSALFHSQDTEPEITA